MKYKYRILLNKQKKLFNKRMNSYRYYEVAELGDLIDIYVIVIVKKIIKAER